LRVDVYRNLNQKCFSIRSREPATYGKVIAHAQTVAVRNVKFVVQPAGRDKVIKTGAKNVHAFVRGDLLIDSPNGAWHSLPGLKYDVTYLPYEYPFFIAKAHDVWAEVNSAELVLMTSGKNIVAKGVK